MDQDTTAKSKDIARVRGSKRSVHAAFHPAEPTPGPSREPAKNLSNDQAVHLHPVRHKRLERSGPPLQDPSIITGPGRTERELPRQPIASTSTAVHSVQHSAKKRDAVDAPARQHAAHLHTTQRSHRTKPQAPVAIDNPDADRRSSTWKPWPDAEKELLKKELEEIKKTMSEYQKMIKKQNKHIKELTAQLSTVTQAKKEQDLQYQLLKTKASKQDDLISTVESSLQCQICIDILCKPQALSPCGHVFCLSCLQAWFRKAPTIDDDMPVDSEVDSHYIMHQPKSCPCCRASVIKKPAPVFVIRDISLAINKAKATINPSETTAPSRADDGDDNPWRGIFPPSDDEDEDEAQHFYDPDFMDEYTAEAAAGLVDPGMLDMFMGRWGGLGISSDSDLEDHDLEVDGDDRESDEDDPDFDREDIFVPMRWEPPAHPVDEHLFYIASSEVWKLLRRGCTILMIQKYDMHYTHSDGITAVVQSVRSGDLVIPGRLTIYLGWNIELDPGDDNGEDFITDMLSEMSEIPERWLVEAYHNGGDSWEARRLVSVSELDSDGCETTSSEVYDEM